MSKKHAALAILPLAIIGLINNAKNTKIEQQQHFNHIRDQLGYSSTSSVSVHRDTSRPARRGDSSHSESHVGHYDGTPRCLKARTDTVPKSLYHKLPKPYINLGFPKMGTSSLHAYFECGGLVSTHFRCGKGSKKCGVCTRESIEAGLPPLSQCGQADMYAQIDDGAYFPQIELLEEFVHGHPDATFFLTFRSMEKWYHSISHWPPRKNGPHMDDRFKKLNITGSPSLENKSNEEEFSDWYCKHVTRVRDIVAQNPTHSLVEVDIEDPDIGQQMEDIFGIGKSCWGHTNVNANIHPEVNESDVVLSKAFRQKDSRTIEHDEDREEISEDESEKGLRSVTTEELYSDHKAHDDYLNQACFKARNDTIPLSLYQKLPKPYINLGFPKMGTSSLHAYFECGGKVSAHLKCGRWRSGCTACSECMRASAEAGLPPLAKCCEADMYAQIDNGAYFPQIELLEEFVHGHPDATFFLTFRSIEKWYHSIQNWPPRKNGPHMDDRFKKLNITGSPPIETKSNLKEFGDWYCNHVNKVRRLVAENPSHTLVEVDIEDPNMGQRMQDVFGIKRDCWGHANANAIIHPELNFSRCRQKVRKEGRNNKVVREQHASTSNIAIPAKIRCSYHSVPVSNFAQQ